MATYTQTGRPMRVSTALGGDTFLLAGFAGEENTLRCRKVSA
jgi:hypothetical protein